MGELRALRWCGGVLLFQVRHGWALPNGIGHGVVGPLPAQRAGLDEVEKPVTAHGRYGPWRWHASVVIWQQRVLTRGQGAAVTG
jgi:hypothetical protein